MGNGQFQQLLSGSSARYRAMGADHPLPPECHDDQQQLISDQTLLDSIHRSLLQKGHHIATAALAASMTMC